MSTPFNPGGTGVGTTSPEYTLHIVTGQPTLAILTLTSDFRIYSHFEMPNRWRRFWCWALLGWKWSKP